MAEIDDGWMDGCISEPCAKTIEPHGTTAFKP